MTPELFISVKYVFYFSGNSILLCLRKYFKNMVFRKSTEKKPQVFNSNPLTRKAAKRNPN